MEHSFVREDQVSVNGTSPDLDDLERLYVVPQEHLETEETDGVSDIPEVGKPSRQAFFQVHPESIAVSLLRLEESGDYYLCARGVEHPEIRDYRLFLVRTKTGKLLLWPVALPRIGEDAPASRQARAIAATAMGTWVSMRWVGGKGGHYCWKSYPGLEGAPSWPAKPLLTLVLLGFDGKIIQHSDDHRLLALPHVTE